MRKRVGPHKRWLNPPLCGLLCARTLISRFFPFFLFFKISPNLFLWSHSPPLITYKTHVIETLGLVTTRGRPDIASGWASTKKYLKLVKEIGERESREGVGVGQCATHRWSERKPTRSATFFAPKPTKKLFFTFILYDTVTKIIIFLLE